MSDKLNEIQHSKHKNTINENQDDLQKDVNSLLGNARPKSYESKEADMTAGWPLGSDIQSKSRQSTIKIVQNNLNEKATSKGKALRKTSRFKKV